MSSSPECARFVLFTLLYSVGQLVLDSLSVRLGARLSPDKSIGGYIAETRIEINDRPFDIALYKTRAYFGLFPSPNPSNPAFHNKRRRHEHFRAPGLYGSPEDLSGPVLFDRFT